jgi:hypothetical protein
VLLILSSKNRPINLKATKNQSKYTDLRKRHQTFVYQSYSYSINNGRLEASFLFQLDSIAVFNPTVVIPARGFYNFELLPDSVLGNLVFHIGMVELISYWKAACPPQVVIKPHKLNREQVDFWKKLYYNGLGEFFYLNGIKTSVDDFMQISSEGDYPERFNVKTDGSAVMVPVGGGKDSVVTLELLKKSGNRVVPMAMNPREAVVRTIENAGFGMGESIVVERTLDKKLLELNARGYLNGHTPFSALLAFVTAFTAVISGIKYIALSNESSANESTVPGSNINHQYSKSFEFEEDFNGYLSTFVTSGVKYFSFLRPLNELQIGALFSIFKKHHFSFRSCNVGSKTDSWCGHCPKCLFTRIILGPFLGDEKLKAIFGKELFEDESLKPVFDELTGNAYVKPFECVGTPDEVNAAVLFMINKQQSGPLPVLLKDYPVNEKGDRFAELLKEFNNEHNLPEIFETVLKENLKNLLWD